MSQAAFDVIRSCGYANFRTSAVSKLAGVSQGAQLHHFPTKNSLAIAAIKYAYEQADILFDKKFQTQATGPDLVNLVLTDFKDFYFSEYFLVALDVLMAIGRQNDIGETIGRLAMENRKKVERMWTDRLITDGWQEVDASCFIDHSHSLIRGYSARALVSNVEAEVIERIQQWRDIVTKIYGV